MAAVHKTTFPSYTIEYTFGSGWRYYVYVCMYVYQLCMFNYAGAYELPTTCTLWVYSSYAPGIYMINNVYINDVTFNLMLMT